MEKLITLGERNFACIQAILITLQEILSLEKNRNQEDRNIDKDQKFDLLPKFPVKDVEVLKKLEFYMDADKS